MIRVKRVYDPRAHDDGRRVLVERLWPRGVTKQALGADEWMKDVAPSTELRKWFAHDVARWDEFQRRYRAELDDNASAWEPLVRASADGDVTLLYSAHDTAHNGAVVLCDYLRSKERRAPRSSARTRTTKASARSTSG